MSGRINVIKHRAAIFMVAALLIAFLGFTAWAQTDGKPFGGDEDVAFAAKVWEAIDGYHGWRVKTDIMMGRSPHDDYLQTYWSVINVGDDYYHAVVKDNFYGEDLTAEMVAESPGEYLDAVTVMIQRGAGYDPDNNNWYWVKYNPDGNVATNPKDMKLAGRVAKGADQGCIACHAAAEGGDYLFTND